MSVSKQYGAFGKTMNMDVCDGIYPVIAPIFIAQIYAIQLDITGYMLIAVTATVASIGTAGVPGIAMVIFSVTLGVVKPKAKRYCLYRGYR